MFKIDGGGDKRVNDEYEYVNTTLSTTITIIINTEEVMKNLRRSRGL